MEEVLLFGVSPLSERVAYYIDKGDSVKNFSVKGFVIDDEYFSENNFADKKVYRYSEAKEKFSETIPIIICIGYKNMNENRKNIFYRLQAEDWSIESYISKRATIHADSMGIGNIFLATSEVGVKSTIGDGNVFDSGFLSHHCKMGNFNYFTENSCGGSIQVGDCCFVGMNSCLKNGIKLPDKTLVGACAYLRHSPKKIGRCYAPPKSVLLGESEIVMQSWIKSKNL